MDIGGMRSSLDGQAYANQSGGKLDVCWAHAENVKITGNWFCCDKSPNKMKRETWR